jgi:heptosyltransferase-2
VTLSPTIHASRILVIMPNWLGDGVMATPFLRALRAMYPNAHIATLARPLVAPVIEGLPYVNEIHPYRKGDDPSALRWLREQRFDLAVLLPNSFRSAILAFRARIPRRLGYARAGRSLLLTDRIYAPRRSLESFRQNYARDFFRRISAKDIGGGVPLAVLPVAGKRMKFDVELKFPDKVERDRHEFRPVGLFFPIFRDFAPIPTIDYYLKLAEYLGANAPSRHMDLATTPDEQQEAAVFLSQISNPKSQISNLITLVPGANFGSSKCWPPERFAQLADHLADPSGSTAAHVLLASSPAELPIVDAILAAATHKDRIHALAHQNDYKGLSIGALKELVRRSSLMICNDTGPRHFAAAFGVPIVTLFGPTDPVWAETFASNERIVRVDVPCGPCQLKKCPIDHRCMKGISVEMVMNAIAELLNSQASLAAERGEQGDKA